MIDFQNVSFSYANSNDNSIQDLNLHIKKGEVVVLCGESGCGKTTITRLINGLIPNYYEGILSGSVLINGESIVDKPLHETAFYVSSVFQNPKTQFFNVDTTSEIVFGCENQGLQKKEIQQRYDNVIKAFKIQNLTDRNIFSLSGGEKQKIACAGAAITEPEILVLDEPTSNLDTFSINDLSKLIELWKKQGKTIIIAEHRLYFLRKYADRVIYMQKGKIKGIFSPDDMDDLSDIEYEMMGLRSFDVERLYKHANDIIQTENHKEKKSCNNLGMQVFNNLLFSYRHKKNALCIKSLQVKENSISAIIGHNGAGKTTFARCMCGLERKCKGEVTSSKQNCKCNKNLRNCYMVMQDVNHQLFSESVLDEVLLSMNGQSEYKSLTDEQKAEEAKKILQQLDLLQFAEAHPMSLSGGQKQRVAIAGAIASGKKTIIFDEPTSGLDLVHMQEVASIIKSLSNKGKNIYIITHDLELILLCCNFIVRIENGKIEESYHLNNETRKQLIDFFKMK